MLRNTLLSISEQGEQMKGLSQKPLVNFVGFQLYWWACILLQNNAVPVCCLLLLLHLYCHQQRRQEIKSLLLLGLLGFTVDFILALYDWFSFSTAPSYIPPAWLFFLWLGFATNITTLSEHIKSNYLVMALVGAAFAPLSYLAAAKLGAVTLPQGFFYTWVLLVPIWFFLLPTLFFSQYKIEDSYLET